MNTAKAAAAASTPNVKGGIYLDSFDSRVVEYQYAIIKLEALIKHIKSLQIKLRANPTMIPLIHYIVIVTGPLMNISEILSKRMESIGNLISIGDQRKVAPSANTNVLNFEIDDQQEITPVKYDFKGNELLAELLVLYENALMIYQKKIELAIMERDANRIPAANGDPIPIDLNVFKDIFEPMELNSLPKLVVLPDELESYQFKRVPIIIDSINKSAKLLKDYAIQLESFKNKPNDTSLKKLPHWNYTIHRILACFVKLSELYTILRKLGRVIYLPVDEHLHNAKILHNNVKLELSLNEADEFLKNPRTNQNLVFTLAKCTRQGSIFQVKGATITEFINTLNQSVALITKMSSSVLNLVKNWELAESKLIKIDADMRQREKDSRVSSSTSPTKDGFQNPKKLEILFNPEKEKLSQEYIAKQQKERQILLLEDKLVKGRLEKEKQALEEEKFKKKFEERERKLREELIKEREVTSPTVSRQGSFSMTTTPTRLRSNSNGPVTARRARSNSNGSVSSTSSNSSLNALSRPDSISSPKFSSPTNLSRTSSLQKRPASVYISSPAFDIRTQLRRQQATAAASANSSPRASSSPPKGYRRRSQSLQSSLPSTQDNNASLAAAAGAAALKQERHSSLKSKSEIHHQEVLRIRQQQSSQVSQTRSSVLRSRSSSPLRYKEELPNIEELALDSPLKKKSQPLKSAMAKKPQAPEKLFKDVTLPTSKKVLKEFPSSPPKQTINEFSSPSPQNLTIPDLIHETTSESSDSTYEHVDDGSIKSLETMKPNDQLQKDQPNEDESLQSESAELEAPGPESPKPIIKKVRFIGVPNEIEETKPKRKGWIHPPRLLSINKSAQPRSRALGAAADALQQERLIFHNIKRGKLDVNTGSIVIPNTSNTRIMNTLAANTNNQHRLGKWRLGLNR